MNRKEHLLTILGEECAEVAQRCSKALRFGLDEVQPGQELTNAQRIHGEFIDLLGVAQMLQKEGILPEASQADFDAMHLKIRKVEKFLAYSHEQGTLTE